MPVFRGKITLETSASFHVFALAYVLHKSFVGNHVHKMLQVISLISSNNLSSSHEQIQYVF